MQYKYIGTAARTEPVIMAPGDIVTLEPDEAQSLFSEGLLLEMTEQDPPEATEAATRLAESEDFDLHTVVGTGTDGRITHEDVQKAIAARDQSAETHEEGDDQE